MFRELLDKFSGRQLTAVALAAILVPGALGAAVTFQPVAIVDPGTGKQSHVDGARRLFVVDPVAGYTNDPGNIVNIADFSTNASGFHPIYTVPNGKTLLIRSISWSYYSDTEGNNSYAYLYDVKSNVKFNFEGLHVAESQTASFAPGILVASGALSFIYSGKGGSRLYIQGDLLPASAAPAPSSQEAAEQLTTSGRLTGQGQSR
ncbi:hypothetical protein [Methylocella sp.]|uniref:hypothetical protein n=1 Tax=Methylocella sp. TaxID=1978226 RepID=UPI0035B434FA